VVAFVRISEKFGRSLDLHAKVLKAINQEPFVLVLRKDVQEAVRREIRDNLLERHPRRFTTADP
jgi:hypothetical protein